MPNYKEMYLELFRGIEQANKIQIEAQRHCEEMYINAPKSELRILPKQDEGEPQSQAAAIPDWKGMYDYLFQESHKAVAVMMNAQIQCDAMDMNSLETEIKLLHRMDRSNLIPDDGE